MNCQPRTHAPSSPLSQVIEWYRRRRSASDIARLDADEARRLAADFNISVDDLVACARQSGDESALMTRMMAVNGIDRARIEAEMPDVIRQMAVTCAHCGCKEQCAHDLDTGASAAHMASYCHNAGDFNALKRA